MGKIRIRDQCGFTLSRLSGDFIPNDLQITHIMGNDRLDVLLKDTSACCPTCVIILFIFINENDTYTFKINYF